MRVLLSTIGSRGDMQPLVALALALRALGHEARLCAPPDFRELSEGLEIPFVALGPELRSTAKPGPSPTLAQLTPQQLRQRQTPCSPLKLVSRPLWRAGRLRRAAGGHRRLGNTPG